MNDNGEVVAEVFRSDAKKSLEVSLFEKDLPFVQIERLLKEARTLLGTFEDGSSLPSPLA
ncbi:hypothetical protein [Burkholderia sp. S-53]|uniref:hypothetical protein n=1 Tax=Burkholderia sp. S-53 TaxID=2906514 RepID=UPI0021CE6CD6|nr:hypothetical protein [Burkholderia sp. S-53]UXU90045.1 hypothetical protein LXM88_32510 [Burkholderia sp. S-53]